MKKLILLTSITSMFLVGCNDYTVEYWNTHQEERNTFLKKCANGDEDRKSQNCENARLSLSRDKTIR